MASSLMSRLIRRIRWRGAIRAEAAVGHARPGEGQAARLPHQAEFIICDQPIDITYIRLPGGWLYLVAFLDWHSRFIVSWDLDPSLAVGSVLAALERALA